MTNNSGEVFSLKPSRGLLLLTLLLGITPFILYGWAIHTGSLPSEQEWSARGGNHGPWWGTNRESVILLCLCLLSGFSFWSFVIGVYSSLKLKKLAPFIQGLAFAALQFALADAQVMMIFWTID